jgi:hypothetical protein
MNNACSLFFPDSSFLRFLLFSEELVVSLASDARRIVGMRLR